MKKIKGFTLIEVIVYIAIMSTIVIALSSLFSVLLQTRVRNQTVTEVDQVGVNLMQKITQTIKNSSGINSPAKGTSSSILSLSNAVSSINPTVFSLNANNILITEGVNSSVILNSNTISISSLTFQNVSGTSNLGNIKITFIINYITNSNREEFNYSQTFNGTSTIR